MFDPGGRILVARLVITGQWRPVRARWMWLTLAVGWVISMNLPNPLGFVAPWVPGLILALGTAATADINGSTNIMTRRWAMWLGDRSFAFYLIHGNVLIFSEKAIGQGPYPLAGAILFTLGIFGIFLNRKNVIIILMSIELILLSVNINLVAFSSHLGDLVGQIFALLVLTVAAAEAAIGLAILVVFYRNRGSIAVEDINLMKG